MSRFASLKPSRLESLTEGIFAIAMTILVLDVKLPAGGRYDSAGLWAVLAGQGQILYNYFVSFALLGLFWIVHNRQFRYLTRTSSAHIWLNIGMLACVSLVPFTTQLYHLDVEGRTADVLFAANLLLVGLFL
ncbi:MAG: TMEM175 family protein, partial [Desulfovibrionaceae bacterium]